MIGFTFSLDYWIYMLPAIVLTMLASLWVNTTYRKWGQVQNGSGMTGAEVARRLLLQSNLGHVSIEGTRKALGDHFDPRTDILRLSPDVSRGRSVAAMAVAAHEIGHALQDARGYLPLRIRSAIVPVANIGSTLGWILVLVGLVLQFQPVAWVGVFAFSLGALFAFATLPVELNASARANQLLQEAGFIKSREDRRGVRAMLSAAAFTYVAALAAALLQLLYYVSLVAGIGRRRR